MAALTAPERAPSGREAGSAVVEFVLVSALLTMLFLAVLQLGLALHVRNTLAACAQEGARYGAAADVAVADGAAATRDCIAETLSSRLVRRVEARMRSQDGLDVVEVRVDATLPLLGFLGPRSLRAAGLALREGP